MKKLTYILIVLLASAICSCGSHKSNMKQETTVESGSNHQRKDTASFSEKVKKVEHEDVTETIEETTTVYDTGLPVDSATGKRPVLSETKKTTKRESTKQKQEDKSKTLNQSSVEQSRDSTKIADRKSEAKQKEETTVPRQIGWVVWGLVAFVGLVFVWWEVYRCRKK